MELQITLDKFPLLVNEAVKQFTDQQQKLIETGDRKDAQPISFWLVEFAKFITPEEK